MCVAGCYAVIERITASKRNSGAAVSDTARPASPGPSRTSRTSRSKLRINSPLSVIFILFPKAKTLASISERAFWFWRKLHWTNWTTYASYASLIKHTFLRLISLGQYPQHTNLSQRLLPRSTNHIILPVRLWISITSPNVLGATQKCAFSAANTMQGVAASRMTQYLGLQADK